MAGRPKTRAKKIARGECVCPARGCPIHKTELARAVATDTLPQPGSPQWGELLERAREEVDYLPQPQSVAEAEHYSYQRLLPKAFEVLESQLDSDDERVSQKAAIHVIEQVKGKAPQTVKLSGEQVHTVRYESAAWTWGRDVIEGEVLAEDDEPPALPEAS